MENLITDNAVIAATLKEMGDQVICTEPTYILIPERYYSTGMAIRGETEQVYGIFPIATETHRGFHSVCAMIETEPSRIVETKIDGEGYARLEYDIGDAFVKKRKVVQKEGLIFDIFDEFMFKGKPPYGMSYNDLLRVFDTMVEYAGLKSIKTLNIIEVMAMAVSKDPYDPSIPYRESIHLNKEVPQYRAMTDVINVVSGTLNKLSGAGFNEGMVDSLLREDLPRRQVERLILK